MNEYQILHGDSLALLKDIPDDSIDSIVTDPPYALSFLNKEWDKGLPNKLIWIECLRVLKPGGHAVIFGATRTHHRLWCDVEDAGFEVRDTLAWAHTQGFPKGSNIAKAIDKKLGLKGEYKGEYKVPTITGNAFDSSRPSLVINQTKPESDLAKKFEGWNTNLKPALEMILLVRKPLSEKTIADNMIKHNVGAINLDACRIGFEDNDGSWMNTPVSHKYYSPEIKMGNYTAARDTGSWSGKRTKNMDRKPATNPTISCRHELGRWPANFLHDGSDEVMEEMGPYSRYFFCSKANTKEKQYSDHPTQKPVKLMEWLCKLITKPDGIILDPFAGSGTTGVAAVSNGFTAILIEKEEQYVLDIKIRMAALSEAGGEEFFK